jgi:iron uptake system component EfeO
LVTAVLAGLLTALLAACSSGDRSAADGPIRVSVSVSACGQGWTGGVAGPQSFVLHNTDTRSGEVDLIDARTGAVYAEVEPLGPGTTDAVQANLGAGRYAFRCSMEDEASVTGPTATLTGPARGDTPGVQAVSQGGLIVAAKAYGTYVTTSLPGLLERTRRLQADVTRGNLSAARRDWLPAHLAYLRLGAAYGAFGEVDADINGLPDGLANGVSDQNWHGFHRLEYGLWHGQPSTALRPVADALVTAVQGLVRDFPREQVDPLDIGIRAHEITEDALRFSLSGRDDYGSHSTVDTLLADAAATREVLTVVHALLAPRYPGLPQAEAQLTRTEDDIAALRPAGRGPALADLSRSQRERLDADISEQAELLAPVAAILEPRRTS